MENVLSVFGLMVFFMVYALLWWTPFICARQNKNKDQIFWVTVFLGWIPLVWMILLLSALLGDKVDTAAKVGTAGKRKK